MSIQIKECLGCGTPVAGEFKLCPACCSKIDVGRFAAEPILASRLSIGGAKSSLWEMANPEDPGLVVAFTVLFLASMVGLGHLVVSSAHMLSQGLGLWFDHFC